MNDTADIIEQAFEQRAELSATKCPDEVRAAVDDCLAQLNSGALRVAEPPANSGGEWQVNQWVKKAVMLSFVLNDSQAIHAGYTQFYDKVPLRYADASDAQLADGGVRIVPPAVARYGSYQAPGVILMPSYVNIGAYIDSGTMVDTWATVGSCAQIGKNVHLSGGVGIGGVLEPLNTSPTIIEDNCFIGARSEIVEGVVVERNAVISMGVYIGQSTRIYDREKDEITFGRVPENAVVVSGNLPSSNGKYSLYCAVIVKRADEKTRSKLSLNELLRDIK